MEGPFKVGDRVLSKERTPLPQRGTVTRVCAPIRTGRFVPQTSAEFRLAREDSGIAEYVYIVRWDDGTSEEIGSTWLRPGIPFQPELYS